MHSQSGRPAFQLPVAYASPADEAQRDTSPGARAGPRVNQRSNTSPASGSAPSRASSVPAKSQVKPLSRAYA